MPSDSSTNLSNYWDDGVTLSYINGNANIPKVSNFFFVCVDSATYHEIQLLYFSTVKPFSDFQIQHFFYFVHSWYSFYSKTIHFAFDVLLQN